MPDTHLLERASEILFGDKKWHEKYAFVIDDPDPCYFHPDRNGMVSYPQVLAELSEVK